MNAADRVIRWSTALAVVGVAAVAAVVSYEHASDLIREHGESGWTGRLIPLTVDGLIYASSMVMLDSAGRGMQVPVLARWLLSLGIAATLAAHVAHGLGHGPVGAAVAAWPAAALVGSYELLMTVIRGSQSIPDGMSGSAHPGPASGAGNRDIRRSVGRRSRSFNPRDPRSVPRWPAPGAAAARLPRCRNCEVGRESRCMSNLREGPG
jgi:Protein of unknown function (DUF2637)